ncbi:uncharacterized protein LOC123311514 isoform X2 [Coccinella septempunctata]|uniref:uncharacterized protein LOC123311514 isoform X2 n=1 Tax=Coccinella septempunctata TaxID=41139 RepID=UPI001D07578C|nr:uncharacterized protein LOC123311514 isoform X2 [Coccinella septempunctata]
MVGYAPALLAMALNLDGVHIFKEPRATNNGPYLSCFIFMIAVFIFATHLEIYPSHFRKLWWCGNMILQLRLRTFCKRHIQECRRISHSIISEFYLPKNLWEGPKTNK